jgi:hypothetical protein
VERFCVLAVTTAAAQLPAWLSKLKALAGETKLENHMRRHEPMKEITPTELRPSFTEKERGSTHRDVRCGFPDGSDACNEKIDCSDQLVSLFRQRSNRLAEALDPQCS